MRQSRISRKPLWGLFFLWSICLLHPTIASAEQGIFTPKIMLQSTYDDNVVFKGKGDFEFRITPSVKMEYGAEDWNIKGGGKAALFRYADLTKYERENYDIWLGGEKDLSERFQVNFDTSFAYDHTFVDELTQSGTETTPTLRRKYAFTPGAMWSVTEKDQLSFSVPLSQTKYAGRTNPDSTSTGGVVGWTHILNNERTSLLAQGTYNHHYFRRSDGKTNQDVFTMMGGASYKPSELINLVGYLGLGYADSKVTLTGSSDKTKKTVYPSFDLSGTYSREKWKFTLGADRMVSPSIYGESSLRTRGRASGEYFFTERLSAYLETAYYNTETGGLVTDNKTRTYYVRPWLMYRWSEDSTIRLEYKHTDIKNRITDATKHQNRVGIRFEYSYPVFY